jgi:hypothetical protein
VNLGDYYRNAPNARVLRFSDRKTGRPSFAVFAKGGGFSPIPLTAARGPEIDRGCALRVPHPFGFKGADFGGGPDIDH